MSGMKPFEPRPLERLREHYRIEKELARLLRSAPRDQRRSLYTRVYDELFRRIPDHPQLAREKDPNAEAALLAEQVRLVQPLLRPESVVLEIGCGDCALARTIAPLVKTVYAVDVSPDILRRSGPLPPNVLRAACDGCTMPVPDGCVDLAFSNQLMEHLHPDDAAEQLRAIYRTLSPRGRYLCVTPNRLSGPYDISRYFDRTATGFHLKEYTVFELAGLFQSAGFTRPRVMLGASRPHPLLIPVLFVAMLERILLCLPGPLCSTLARRLPIGALRVIRLIGVKQERRAL